MKILCAFGEYAYGDRRRGKSYEYVNFLPAFKALGHHIDFIDIWDRSGYRNFSELNFAFLEKVEQTEPDVIFFVLMGYELWLETLNLAKKNSRAVLVNWSTDDSWKYEQFSKYVANAFDLYVTTYKSAYDKSKENGFSNFVLSQWAANGEQLLNPVPAHLCKYQISFIGAAYGNRRKWISLLSKHGFNVECFGYGWNNGVISDEELPKIINNSMISLNFGDSGLMFRGILPYRSRQIKARIFEVLGYGGCLVTESDQNIANYYCVGEDLLTFDSPGQLLDLLGKLIDNPAERDRITQNGHLKTAKLHTYTKRFEEILTTAETLLAEKNKHQHATNGQQNQISNHFESIAKQHSVGILLKCLRRLILIPCVILFGKAKGPRAARRILFELSWRILGKSTYTARGLPGRLFYRES